MRKVEVLVTLRGNVELWPAGTVFDYDTMPGEIATEIALGRGTVRVFEEVVQRPVVPPPPSPEDQPSFSEVAKSLLTEELEEEEEKEEELEEEEIPRYSRSHRGGRRWNVIDLETGERMNEDYLSSKEEADALIAKLEEDDRELKALADTGTKASEAAAKAVREAELRHGGAGADKPALVVREEDSD